MPQTGRSLWWSASLIFLSLAGCGEPQPDSPLSTSSALTAPRSYLVSFTGGDIPANADALVKAGGGQIAARYPNVGAILARSSSPSFAPALRSSSGIAAVGAVTAASTKLTPIQTNGRPTTPKTSRPTVGGDPLSFRQWDMDQIHVPQARSITSGSKSVLVGLVDSGVDITHPDLVGQVNAAASASCIGGIPDASPAAWTHDVFGHGTFTSGIVAAKKNGIGVVGVAPGVQLPMVKVLIDDINDVNFGLIFRTRSSAASNGESPTASISSMRAYRSIPSPVPWTTSSAPTIPTAPRSFRSFAKPLALRPSTTSPSSRPPTTTSPTSPTSRAPGRVSIAPNCPSKPRR